MAFPPEMTKQTRNEALHKATETRKARAQVKRDLKAGEITLNEVLNKKTDPVVGKMRVRELLRAIPGVGTAKAATAMQIIGIAENRRVAGMSARQEAEILARFGN